MLRAGQHTAVLREADWYFAQPGLSRLEAVWVAANAAAAACQMRQWGRAVLWADRGLALNPTELHPQGMLRLYAGTALMYTGELNRAEAELRRFRTVAEAVPSLAKLHGDVLYNLACLMSIRKRTREERALFSQAAAAYDQDGRFSRAAACHCWVAWSHLLDDELEQALPALDTAEDLLDTWADPELAIDLAIARALYHRLAGETAESDGICQTLLAEGGLASRQMADVAWLLGMNALTEGLPGNAESFLAQAYAAAVEDWWPPQIDRITTLKLSIPLAGRTGR